MSKKKIRTTVRSTPEAAHSRIPVEAKGLMLIALSILALLCLVSFSQNHPHANWLGLIGHAIGWLSLYIFGLSSYLLLAYVAWTGWRLLCNKPIPHYTLRTIYFGIFLSSCCILLNLFAEVDSSLARWFEGHIYSELATFREPYAYSSVRYNLGGVPFYYFLSDIPHVSLQDLLSKVGASLVFTTFFIVSGLLFTETEVMALIRKIIQTMRSWWHSESSLPEPALEQAAPPPEEFSDVPLPFTATTPKSRAPTPAMPTPPRTIKIAALESATAPKIVSLTPPKTPSSYTLPPESLLTLAPKVDTSGVEKDLKRLAEKLEETLLSFGIEAKVGDIHCGPTITCFEVHPAIGVKVQKIKTLADDIALNMQAKSMRILAPIPGKAAVGIEIPSPKAREVSFKDLLLAYQQSQHPFQIPMLLGKTVNGENVMYDLAKMPHMLIAGATGSGKSVCINTIIVSILMTARPDEIKLLMIDPKKVELSCYQELPHMIAPVITEPHRAHAALNWLVKEMERRYDILKAVGARNIHAYNEKPAAERQAPPDSGLEFPEKLHTIVAIIDELADLMMVSASDIETPIARLAQMARAVGIHLIIATQRPSREVITGLIKANFPARLAFKVASRINSQIILDDIGAEALLGNGDMLFLRPGAPAPMRAQGSYVRDEDINRVIDFICKQQPPQYLIQSFDESSVGDFDSSERGQDSLYEKALEIVLETGNASTTFLQRKLKIGYARAASLMDELEQHGVVSPPDGSKARRVLNAQRPPSKPSAELSEEFE